MFEGLASATHYFSYFIDLKWIFFYTQLTRFTIRCFFFVRFYRTFLLHTIITIIMICMLWPSKNKIIWICMCFFTLAIQQNGIDKFHLNHSSKINRFLLKPNEILRTSRFICVECVLAPPNRLFYEITNNV